MKCMGGNHGRFINDEQDLEESSLLWRWRNVAGTGFQHWHWKLEQTVYCFPQVNIVAAIPVQAAYATWWPMWRRCLISMLKTNVFPAPPGASTWKHLACGGSSLTILCTASSTQSTNCRCTLFSSSKFAGSCWGSCALARSCPWDCGRPSVTQLVPFSHRMESMPCSAMFSASSSEWCLSRSSIMASLQSFHSRKASEGSHNAHMVANMLRSCLGIWNVEASVNVL